MFKFRYIKPRFDSERERFVTPILQVMQTHEIKKVVTNRYEYEGKHYYQEEPHLKEIDNPQWQTVETIYDDTEYDKARGFSVPEPCEDAK